MDFTYNFNAGTANNGNVIGITNNRNTARSQSFTYDELNRILTAQSQAASGTHCWGESLSYDPWANLTGRTVTKCSAEGAVPAATIKNQAATYCYDIAGNLVNQGGCGTIAYTYNAENQLATAGGVTYTYDGDGNRVKKSNGTLYWFGAGDQILKETDLAGNNPKDYIFFAGKRVARRDSATVIHYYFSDHLGSSNVVTNKTGLTIEEESDFYPFGGERVIIDTVANQKYKFTGMERDAETNLDYFGARYYAANFARFTTVDPGRLNLKHFIVPQKWNKYSYTINNPLRFVDPTGEAEVEIVVRAYIPPDRVGGFGGDSRSNSTDSNASSRVSVSFTIETDRAKRGSNNPMLSKETVKIQETKFYVGDKVVASDTSTGPNPPSVVAAYDPKTGNTTVQLSMDMANPLTPGVQGIRTDLQITVPEDASSISIEGNVSGSPAFEANVTVDGGETMNIPIQDAPTSAVGFVLGLEKTNPVNIHRILEE